MKIRVAIAINDNFESATAFGSMTLCVNASKSRVYSLASDREESPTRLLWAEIEIPDPPAPIQAVATTEDE